MYTKLLQYHIFSYSILSFSFIVFFLIGYSSLPSDESQIPESIFSRDKTRKTLLIFFYLLFFLSVRTEREGIPYFFFQFNTIILT
jgi:hypothetical protein